MKIRVVFPCVVCGLLIAVLAPAAGVRASQRYSALDPAGDRLNGDFDFWAVRPQNGNYNWVRIGSYNNGVLTLF